MGRLNPAMTAARLATLWLEASRAPGFAFVEDQAQVSYDFHTHTRHQILYALEGSVRLEVEDASYLLPPQRAAFIPAGVRHMTTVRKVRIISIYLPRKVLPKSPREVCVLSVTPLMREMFVYAARWSPARDPRCPVANAFFVCMGQLAAEWLSAPVAARLPRGESVEVRAAIDYIGDQLSDANLALAARAAGCATRTLRRKLQSELGTSFRELLAQARLMRAMELLSEPEQTVTSVAFGLGYDSLSAFSRRFARFAGETPSAYRTRVKRGQTPTG